MLNTILVFVAGVIVGAALMFIYHKKVVDKISSTEDQIKNVLK